MPVPQAIAHVALEGQLLDPVSVTVRKLVPLLRRWKRRGVLLCGEGPRQPTDQGEQSCCRDGASGHAHLRRSWVGGLGAARTPNTAKGPMSHGTPRVTPA